MKARVLLAAKRDALEQQLDATLAEPITVRLVAAFAAWRMVGVILLYEDGASASSGEIGQLADEVMVRTLRQATGRQAPTP